MMPVKENIKAVHNTTWKPLLLIILATLATIIVVVLLGEQYGVSVAHLTQDPAAATGYPAYIGFVSQFGLILWSATAMASLLAYWVCHGTNTDEFPFDISPTFLLSSASLTILLGVDDAFMLHDRIFPEFGVHELFFYILYGSAGIGYLLIFLRTILRTEFLLLLSALALFALSVFTDLLFEVGESPLWFEDGTKGIGILCWFFYHIRTSAMVLEALSHANTRSAPSGT